MRNVVVLTGIALLVRVLLMLFVEMPFSSDVHLFQFWAINVFEGGFYNFYRADFFADYPPMYIYVLWIIGAIASTAGLTVLSPAFNFLVFLPAVIADTVTVGLVYVLCRQLDIRESFAFLTALMYSLNPAVLINSAVWGQVDAIHSLILVIAIYMVCKNQTLPAYLVYAVAVLTKPQSLIAAPIFLYSAFYYCKERGFSRESILTMFGNFCATMLFLVLLSLPFGVDMVFEQYLTTLGSRPFASINAYNFYALTGGNWHAITPFYGLVGWAAIIGITFFVFWFLHRRFTLFTAFFSAALLYIITFVFSVRMNERYLFPALIFLLVAAIFAEERHLKVMSVLYTVFSITLFLNCLDILLGNNGIFMFPTPESTVFRPVNGFMALVSFVNVVFAIYTLKFGSAIFDNPILTNHKNSCQSSKYGVS
ncbi:MAG: hypothetical protein FWG65_08570 [Turicibacter sp.]|nr:hypothetical protein [Turicibacter sp.]